MTFLVVILILVIMFQALVNFKLYKKNEYLKERVEYMRNFILGKLH